MTVQSCLELLEKEGVQRQVAGNHPLILGDPQTVCLVASGRVDVFAVPFQDREPAGARIHLFRADPGQVLFGIAMPSEDQVGLVAVGTPDSTVSCLPQARLRELMVDPALTAPVAASLDRWIDGLTGSVARGRPPRQFSRLEPGAGMCYEAETILSPGQGILWVSGSQGTGRFLGRQELLLTPSEALFPLAGSGWLTIQEATTLSAARTESLLGDLRLWAGLERFQSLVLSYVSLGVAEASAADRERLHRKSRSETQLIQGAVSQLAAVVEREELAGPLAISDQDPLVAACQLVGGRMGIPIKIPPGWGEKTRSDPVPAIARASGARTRRVVLADDWWRQDNGPLLAFRAEDDRPVALWPTSRSSYDMLDPVERSRTPVTHANAACLRAQGYCFYRSFPARALSVRSVVQFGLAGTGRDWLTVVLLGLLGGLLGYLLPLSMVLIFGQIIPESDQQRLLLLVGALVASAVAGGLFQFSQGVAMLRLETQMDSAVEAGVWDRLLNLPASFFRQYTAGDLAVRAMGISRIRQVLTQAALSSLFSFLFSLLSFALLFCLDGRLAALATMLFVIVAAIACSAAFVQLRFERQSLDVRGRVAGLVLQLLTGISRLRVAGAENRALAIWAKEFSRQTKLAFQAQSVANGMATFTGAVPILASMAIFAAVTLLPGATLSMPTFLAFNATFVGIIFAAVAMSAVITSILQIVPLYERAKPILETLPESHAANHDPGDMSGDIEISHVSFRYQPDTPCILDDVSIHIRPGEFVAFVGPSGAGKSTILRLLLGFETPNSGSVYYDRGDLVGLDQQAVRRQIGAVLHSSKLTSGDILSNITGGSPTYTLEDAWEAARLSGLEEDIKRMPMGMYTAIAEGEGTLSGGQRQRLMIARAIIAKPRILLFDEATSALDNVTQAKVAQSLSGLKATRVVVAHRLSTVMSADRIYVIDRGKVVQVGTFNELIQQPGMFADLAKRQLLS